MATKKTLTQRVVDLEKKISQLEKAQSGPRAYIGRWGIYGDNLNSLLAQEEDVQIGRCTGYSDGDMPYEIEGMQWKFFKPLPLDAEKALRDAGVIC